jgi:hypothetical protein
MADLFASLDFVASLDKLNLPDALKAQLLQLRPPPLPNVDELTRRLSLVRTFTERTYAAAAGELPAPKFGAFASTSSVEPVIGCPGRFAVSERIRETHLKEWHAHADERTRLAQQLADALDAGDSIERLDRIQVLFLVNQDSARRELQETFEAADRADDIPNCSALVQLVTHTIQLFGDSDSRALLSSLRARSQSRSLFFAEFYQSTRYFSRPIEKEIRQFVQSSDERWIYHLHAPGGMGKTTLLRRMISHEWVVGPLHIPCASLDFDYLDVGTVLQYPGLLGLAMAAQWNEQLEQPVFGGFLTSTFKPLAALLFRNRPDGSVQGLDSQQLDLHSRDQYLAGLSNPMRTGLLSGAVPPRTPEERAKLMQEAMSLHSYWLDKFPDALASMPTDRPVLLVLDTLEDASLAHGQQLLEVLRLIARLRHEAHKLAQGRGNPPVRLRLLLSGRYQLGADTLPEFKTDLQGQYLESALPGLDDPEARAFLEQQIRADAHVQHREDLITEMVKYSRGVPFKLSLFAEWANGDESLDVQTVRRSADISTVWLIERIVKRITYQPLRWVIRYGVVPRALSFDFLRDVMREPLVDALSGRALEQGVDKADSKSEVDVWLQEPGFVFDANALWNDHVLPYTSSRAWITRAENSGQVRFRPDILQPMRQLLRKQPIFAQLHQRSRDWFAAQASDPAKRYPFEIERLYHATQLRAIPGQPPQDLLPELHQLLDADPLGTDASLRVAACDELWKADFSELTDAEKAYVRYRLAEALAAEHDYAFNIPEALESLNLALELQSRAGATTLPPFASLWQQAMQGITSNDFIRRAQELTGDDGVRAGLLAAEWQPESTVASHLLTRALGIMATSVTTIPLGTVASRLAGCLRHTDPENAVHYFEVAASYYAQHDNQSKRSEMLCLAGETEIGLGRLTRAAGFLNQFGPEVTRPVRLQRAQLELATGNPGKALDLLLTLSRDPNPPLDVLLPRAEAFSQRMLLAEASATLEQATVLASQMRDAVALNRIAVDQARLYYDWIRVEPLEVPRTVLSALQRSQSTSAVEEDPWASEAEIWQIVCGLPDNERWRRRALGTLGGESPFERARLILALSRVVQPFPPTRWVELVENVKEMPPSARLRVLEAPVLGADPPQIDPQTRQALVEAFKYEPEGEAESAWYAVRYGALLAWLGFDSEAAEVLAAHVPQINRSDYGIGWRPAVYRERRRIEQRIRSRRSNLDGKEPFPPPEPDPPDLWLEFWGHTPFRASSALVENAQRAYDAHKLDVMHQCLENAWKGLQSVQLGTEFHTAWRRLRGLTGFQDLTSITFGPLPSGQVVADTAMSAANASADPAPLPVGDPLGQMQAEPWFDIVEMHEQSGRVAVRFSGSEREQSEVVSAESPVMEALLRSRGTPRRLVGTPLDGIAAQLREFLEQTSFRPSDTQTLLALPLSSLCCAPWEMAFNALSHPALSLVRLPSQWTPSDLSIEVRADPQLGKPAVPRILQPLSPQDKESPALPIYLALGSQIPQRLEDTGADRDSFRVLYVASCFMEIPTVNEPALAGIGWMATTLAATIRLASNDNLRPFVILDVPATATSTDYVHQLLLRNYFAHALADTGAVSGVLATGLYPPEAMGRLHSLILSLINMPDISQFDLFNHISSAGRTYGLRTHDALFTASPRGPLRESNRRARA